MAGTTQSGDAERDRIILGLLESVERDGSQSQRRLAADLGIALGLVNAYVKRCISKGLLKVNEVPARRYAYYLTPQGFAEKSRLTIEYFSYSFDFFRRAKADCTEAFARAQDHGIRRILLAGISDLADIAVICAPEADIEILAVIDASTARKRFAGLPVVNTLDAVSEADGVLVTDLANTHEAVQAAVARFGADRVVVPALLRGRISTSVSHRKSS